MRLTVLPRSLWIAYTITRPSSIRPLLPPDMDLAVSPLLTDEHARLPSPKLLFNVYDVSSAWMHGTRLEIVTLVRHRRTSRLHFCVLECFTNTLQWDPDRGIRLANAKITRPSPGHDDYTLQVRSLKDRLFLRARQGPTRPIDRRFAVDANRVCYFGTSSQPFAMTFDETQLMQPVRDVAVTSLENTYWQTVRARYPSHVFIHPHAMDFDVDVEHFGRSAT